MVSDVGFRLLGRTFGEHLKDKGRPWGRGGVSDRSVRQMAVEDQQVTDAEWDLDDLVFRYSDGSVFHPVTEFVHEVGQRSRLRMSDGAQQKPPAPAGASVSARMP